MAGIAAQMINTDYDDISEITVVPGGSNVPWNDEDLGNIRRYTLAAMDSASMVLHGGYVFDGLNKALGIDANLLISAVHLAVNLRDPDRITSCLLSAPPASPRATIQTTLPTIRETQTTLTEEEKNALKALGKDPASVEKADREDASSNQGKDTADRSDQGSVDMKAAAYAYICAFLMRLQCRSPQNVLGGLKRAVERFKTWYDGTTSVLEEIDFSIDALSKLKDAISRKPEVTGTWVMYLAVTENEKDLLKQSRGMLEYLGLQVFSYQGMHALTQVLALHQLSKVSLKDLMIELDSPLTRGGLREIATIIRHHERTNRAPDRKTYFRYARVWDTKYFAQLQSKTCVPLLYVAAVAVRDISPNKTSDPTQIYALQNIGTAMKQALDRVAAALTKYIVDKSYHDLKSGSVWEAATAE
ncbi:Nucleocapsid protein [Alphacytorhabdovirus alphapogostemi]|uniref:Nucleoprotein n=1 Tax=Patchouli chlorosis-associated cytorhabdovirus TaxID=2979813 RepID=A0A977KCY3_9RHAB|nr:Nucleocapsid protein [Patchouli chlorosis-associated cytorhabdovirus]